MYPGVPTMSPACVPTVVPAGVSAGSAKGVVAFATPKSSTLTRPSGVSLMLAGFRSRWTIPCSCAARIASATWQAQSRAVATSSGPRSGSPSTNSSTR